MQSHHLNHKISKLIIKPNYLEFRTEPQFFNKIRNVLAIRHARLLNQYKIKHQTVFSARYDKQDEDNQLLDATKFFNISNFNYNLTETNIDEIDYKISFEYQLQQQKLKIVDGNLTKLFQWYSIFTKLVK